MPKANPRVRPVLFASAWLAFALATGCERAPVTPPGPTAWAPALSVGPLTLFQAHCANCHGAYGKDYDPASPINSDMAKLDEMLVAMIGAHAADIKPSPIDLAAQKSFHLAAISQRPFLAVTRHTWPEAGELRGEVTPFARLEIISGPARATIWVEGHTFVIEAKLMAQIRSQVTPDEWLETELVATKGESQTRVKLAAGSFTALRK